MLFVGLFCFAVLATPELSAQLVDGQDDAPHPAVSVGIAYFDVAQRNDSSLGLELGYRWPYPLLGHVWPYVGGLFSADGAGYGYFGLQLPVGLRWGLEVTPSLGAGLYEAGTGMELGSPVQFRSSLQVDWTVHEGQGVSLFFYHISNAGLGSSNPGAEILGLSYRVVM